MADHPVPDDVVPFPNLFEQPCAKCNPTGLKPKGRRGFILVGAWAKYIDKHGSAPPEGHRLRSTKPEYVKCDLCEGVGWVLTPWGQAVVIMVERHLFNEDDSQ